MATDSMISVTDIMEKICQSINQSINLLMSEHGMRLSSISEPEAHV